MKRLAVGILAGFLIGTAAVAYAARPDIVTIRGAGSGAVEGCPAGYICVTEEEYVRHWDVCPVDPDFTPTTTDTPEVTETPTPEGTSTPEFTQTPTDTPEEKEACNRGIGNLEEFCDPGNSSGQGKGEARPAGEDRDEAEGAPPPRRGGGKP